jgi:hypothetical protein
MFMRVNSKCAHQVRPPRSRAQRAIQPLAKFERICPTGLTSAAPQATTSVGRSLRSTHLNSASNAGQSACPRSTVKPISTSMPRRAVADDDSQ